MSKQRGNRPPMLRILSKPNVFTISRDSMTENDNNPQQQQHLGGDQQQQQRAMGAGCYYNIDPLNLSQRIDHRLEAAQQRHMPFDELEMLHHGWMNDHGKHFGAYKFKDELSLLHEGKADASGAHQSLRSFSRENMMKQQQKQPQLQRSNSGSSGGGSNDQFRGRQGMIKFMGAEETEIPASEACDGGGARGPPTGETGGWAETIESEETLVTMNEEPKVTPTVRTVPARGGGELTTVTDGFRTVRCLKADNGDKVYMERSDKGSILMVCTCPSRMP